MTLFRYILREICSIFFVSLMVFIFIIMATRVMGITELFVNQSVDAGQILKIILCLLPRVIIFSMPAACLMCVMLAFIRLSSDNEIIALNSSGISLYQMLAPVIFFSLMTYLFASFIAIHGVPWGNRSYKDVVFRIIKSTADFAVKERVFYEPFDGVVFYVNSFSPKERRMKDLFVVDRRSKPNINTIVAEEGRILSNRGSNIITINFIDGTIFTIEKDFEAVRTIKFESYDLNIDLREIMSWVASREKDPKEMDIRELIDNIKASQGKSLKNNLMGIKLFEMFSIPFAVFLMGIIGGPLGAQVRANGRTKGIVISLLVFLVYYICLMGVRYICESGTLSPSLGVWIPNLFLLITCAYLLARVSNYHPVRLLIRSFSRDQFKGQSFNPEVTDNKAIQTGTAQYFGSLIGHKFHNHDCLRGKRISQKNRVTFESIREATDRGYTPCNICKPL
ncbi:LPS export ABC transporter permease LptF [Thermodesulfobacteriota bacterium]